MNKNDLIQKQQNMPNEPTNNVKNSKFTTSIWSNDEKETASTIMAFFLSGGLFTGGALSFLWTYLINP